MSFRYRCVAKRPLGPDLDDMHAPVQLHFEPTGEDLVARLNRFGEFCPVVSRREAERFEIDRVYQFTAEQVGNDGLPRSAA